ncbi:MAG: thioredoxin family protein [Gemmobacter sp.]|uniref:thioredoxin family protein n=1 Tax=Gemmobacter sp. TaxID=1898957 RepID=UPI00391D13AB
MLRRIAGTCGLKLLWWRHAGQVWRVLLMRRGAAVLTVAMVGAAALWLTGTNTAPQSALPDPIAAARLTGKPVLVEFGAGSCAACREMKGVLADLQTSHGDRMVIVDIDFGTPEGRMVLRKYAMQAIPTQLFYTADGAEAGRHLGAIPADQILARLGLADG